MALRSPALALGLAMLATGVVPAATRNLPLVPTPQNITFVAGGGSTTLTSASRVYYTQDVINGAMAFADDVANVFNMSLTLLLSSSGCASPGAGNVAFCTGPMPPPLPPSPIFPPATCSSGLQTGVLYNNTNFVGEATTLPDAGSCCGLCAATPTCQYYSWFHDPAAPSGTCNSSTPSNCCLMLATNDNPVGDSRFQSGVRMLPPTGSLPAVKGLRYEDATYTLSARAASGIVIASATQQGAHHGGVTLLQAMLPPDAVPVTHTHPVFTPLAPQPVPDMDVLDYPFRPFRGSQLDLSSSYYHDQTLLRAAVDVCRMTKCNTMTLHMGAEGWMGMVMESVSQMNASWRQNNGLPGCYGACLFYTNEEMTSLIEYAYSRGVGFMPVLGSTPDFPYMINALTTRFNPNSTYADFIDEIDHQGPSGFNGTPNARFWNAMDVMYRRSYELFGKGYTGGVLPTVHVGAVLGEGGMDDVTAYQCYKLLAGIDRNVTMSFYDGLCASCNDADHPLYAVRDKMLVHFYTEDYSISTIEDYVANGWPLVSISWLPLYILGGEGPYDQNETFAYNMLFTATSSSSTQDIPFEAGLAADARVWGSMPSTWEMRVPDDLSYMRQRLPAAMENTWRFRGAPVPATGPDSYDAWLAHWLPVDAALDAIVGPTPRMYECTVEEICIPNAFGNGTSYQDDCNECFPSPKPPTPPPGYKIGGRIFLSDSYNLSFPNASGSVQGLAGADAACVADAAGYPAPPWTKGSTWKALLVTEAGCGPNGATPCRRASITPNAGDGQIDWPVAPNAAYYVMSGSELSALSDAHGLLGQGYVAYQGINQASGMDQGFVTLANGTCNSWRYTYDMATPAPNGAPYGLSIGWAALPLSWCGNGQTYPCGVGPFFCVEILPTSFHAAH